MRLWFALLACSLIIGCVSTPAPRAEPWLTDGEITTPQGGEPDTIDPQLASFLGEASVIGMVFEPLLTYDPGSLKLIPAAARALPEVSADGRVYTYRLRSGLTYSDGAPLTAGDFAFAWIRLCDPITHSPFAFIGYPIAGCEAWNAKDAPREPAASLAALRASLGIRAVDGLTLEFTLSKPAAHFPQATALWVGSPVRERDLQTSRPPAVPARPHAWTEPPTYIGNGPFRLTEWKHGERLVFERNDRHWSPARLRQWTKVIISEPAVARAAYEEGRLDAVRVTPIDDVDREALLARPDLVRTLGPCTTYIGFNTQRAPFDDPLVRLAFAKSLDREELARSVDRTGRAAVSLVPHAQAGHAHEDRVQAFDPAEARRLLAASSYGLPVGGQLGQAPLSFTIRSSPRNIARVQWAISQWKAYLGVDVKFDPVDASVGWGWRRGPQIQPQLYLLGWCQDYPDGQDWYSTVFRSGSTVTRTNFSNAAFDAIVDRADAVLDPDDRERLYQLASFILSRSAPVAFLGWSETWTLVRPEVRDHRLSAFDWDFAQFSLSTVYRSSR